MPDRIATVDTHVRAFFGEHVLTEHQWSLGPMPDAMPEFRVLCAAPGPRTGLWTYLSVGASVIEHENVGLLEFCVMSPVEDLRLVELVTMTTWYHHSRRLGLGHTLPIGEPWLGRSACDHLLVSKPYPFGPDLEICELADGGHVHCFWLLPITEAERDFKVEHGLEALEQSFDDAELEFWNVSRSSVA